MTNKKAKPKKNTPTKPKHQNGKGDAPRNVSEKFKNNYEKIKWKRND